MAKNPWKRYEVTCAVCGAKVTKSNPQRTCGISCREALKRKERLDKAPVGTCPFCGEVKPLSHKFACGLVCSSKCGISMWHRANKDERVGSRARTEAFPPLNSSMKCKLCGKAFPQKKSDHVFCSDRCMDKWANRHGLKGRNLRAKKLRLVTERDSAIGSCSLCGVLWSDIRTISELGSARKFGVSRFHMDHAVPRCRGGVATRPLCWFCNNARADMDPATDPAIAAAGRAFWAQIKLLSPASTGGPTPCAPTSSSPSFSCSPAEGLT
jgi:predicted nucleic acid-binding Zn ribbon protein